jgi:adenylate cyclase class IV
LSSIDYIEVGSWDTYFSTGKSDEFIRFREGFNPELTIKKKTVGSNNFNRVEVDLKLSATTADYKEVSKWLSILPVPYLKNFKIYKYCFIYVYSDITLVYCVVYNEEMEEKGRFVEIEIDKKQVEKFNTPGEALKYLNDFEQKLSVLGITPQNRMKKSLWELFRKEPKKPVEETKNG